MSTFYECKQMLCKSRFFISNTNAFYKDADAIFIYDANVPCRDENARFIHDKASARIQTMMQMSPHKDGDVTVF